MRKLLVPLLFLCLWAWSVSAQESDAPLIKAVTLYTSGQNKPARQLLGLITEAQPRNDAAWYYLALSALRDYDVEASVQASQKAVELDSTNFWYRRLQARLCVIQQKPEEGIALYEAMVKDFPDNDAALYEVLDLYLKNQQYEKALTALDEVERIQGLSEEVVRTRYDVYTTMGRQDEGAQMLEQFNEQYSVPSILSILGDYYLADFKDSLALSRYNEALTLDSAYPPAILGKSEVYRHQRQYPAYFQTLEPFFSSEDIPAESKSMYIGNMSRSLDPKILQIHREGFDRLVNLAGAAHPSDSSILSAVGTYYYTTGRENEAGKWFRASADLFPQSVSLTATCIQYLQLQHEWQELKERSLGAFERFQELAFMDYANLACYQLEEWDGIIENCTELLRRYGARDKTVALNSWTQIGDAYYAKGEEKIAFRAYDNALKLNPDYAPVLNNYAYYLCLEGKNLKKAYEMSKKTVEQEPDNATYLDTFAWILHLMGKDLEAKPFFKHAMLYGGKESAVILRHYATVLEALGEEESAKVYRNQAARLDAKEKQ